jgi:hypothetical protein
MPDFGTERLDGPGRGQDIFGFEQARDTRAAGRQRAQDQRAMGDRLVAGDPDMAGNRRRSASGQGLRHRFSIGV